MKRSVKMLMTLVLVLACIMLFATNVKAAEPTVKMEVKGDGCFYVGESNEFTITTTKGDTEQEFNVVGAGSIKYQDTQTDATDALDTLEYLEVNDNKWYDLMGKEFGGKEGFPLADATSTFRATFKKAGTYTVTCNVKKVGEEQIVTTTTLTIKVYDNTLDNHVLNNSGNVDIEAKSDESISKEVLNQLKEGPAKDVTINLNNNVTIAFNTGNITEDFKNDLSLNINITEEKPFEKKLQGFDNADLLYVDIGYSGVLPKDTKITFNVGDTYKAGDKVYLYYFNESTGKAELVAKEIVVTESKTATISIDHASTYFLSKTELGANTEAKDSTPKTGSVNVAVIATVVGVVSFAGILTLKKYSK